MTAAIYRQPGLLAKAVTTLDVLSQGRAWLGIGAAWNEEESVGLGLPFPSTAERFERLEETLQICLQMWSDSEAPFTGKHYTLGRTLNSPQSVQRPHPPILIGGSGERKTLRMVAQYAQACNLFPGPELERKLDVLRGHCEELGRNYDDIEKTVMTTLDPGAHGQNVDAMLTELQGAGGARHHARPHRDRRMHRRPSTSRSSATRSFPRPPSSEAGSPMLTESHDAATDVPPPGDAARPAHGDVLGW